MAGPPGARYPASASPDNEPEKWAVQSPSERRVGVASPPDTLMAGDARERPVNGRREFAAALAGVLLAPAALVQAGSVKVVGYLSGGQGPETLAKTLAEHGHIVGRNLRIEIRIPPDWEEPTLAKAAAELVALRPDALFAFLGNRVGALAAATSTIPIVGAVPDPVGAGFAQSLRRPGRNITGISFGLPEAAEIVIGLFKAMRPGLKRVGAVVGRGTAQQFRVTWYRDACRAAGLDWLDVLAGPGDDLPRALAPLAGEATFIAPQRDPGFGPIVAAAATRLRIMTMGEVAGGALMSYGLKHGNEQGRLGAILDRVLRGANPADIPFELPDRPSFALSRKVARAIGIEIAPEILLRATELIE